MLKPYLQLHFCVLLWGFTGILGRLITLRTVELVWWRIGIAVVVLACLPRIWRGVRGMGIRRASTIGFIGIVIALHWITFYGAIKLANASVAATTMALATVFVVAMEPLLSSRPFNPRELWLGALVIPGVVLVVGGIDRAMMLGLGVGVVSAALAAVFNILNKQYGTTDDPLVVTFLELAAGWIFVSAVLPFQEESIALPQGRDALLLIALAIGCTLLPFSLALVALRKMSAFGTQLAVNLEPVYTIVLAIPLLGEHRELGLGFYAGVLIVLASVLGQPLLSRRAGGKGQPEIASPPST